MLGNIILGIIVLLAVIFAGRKMYKTMSGKSGCGCGDCNCENNKNTVCAGHHHD